MNSRILKLMNSREFYALKAFYNENTIFGALNLERKETRNSAFLGWFFNPMSNHGLGYEPIKLLLRLYFTKTDENSRDYMSLLPVVVSGNYSLSVVENISLEKCVGSVSHQSSKDRFDIWSVLKLSYKVDDDIREVIIPMVIENKVYSGEGENQTERYFNAICEYCRVEHSDSKCFPVNIMLAPVKMDSSCLSFTSLTYQDLLAYIIEPLMDNVADNCKSWVNDYVRNLSITVNDSYSAYRILAVSQKERELVESFYALDRDLVDAIFASQFESEKIGKVLSPEKLKQIDSLIVGENASLIDAIWEAEGEIFKAVVYVKHLLDKSTGKADFDSLFKPSRINAKYSVTLNGKVLPGMSGRLSKAKAAWAVFKAYLQKNPQITLADLRNTFTISLNADLHRYYNTIFMVKGEDTRMDEGGYMHLTRTEGKYKGQDALAEYDFYVKDDLLLEVEGKQVMCPKKWITADFGRLVNKIESLDKDIVVKEIL